MGDEVAFRQDLQDVLRMNMIHPVNLENPVNPVKKTNVRAGG